MSTAIKHFFKKAFCHESVFLQGDWEHWQLLQWSELLSGFLRLAQWGRKSSSLGLSRGQIPQALMGRGQEWVQEGLWAWEGKLKFSQVCLFQTSRLLGLTTLREAKLKVRVCMAAGTWQWSMA